MVSNDSLLTPCGIECGFLCYLVRQIKEMMGAIRYPPGDLESPIIS